MKEMTKSEIAGELLRGRNCAQCVLGACAEDLGYDVEETDRILRCFGGGVAGQGEVCGAVVGSLCAIGLSDYGEEKAWEFERKFKEVYGTLRCRELLGYDFSIPEEAQAARESGKPISLCPEFITTALKILGEIL